jgi:protocatechuate 3,4-dioxygenase beta subunit
VIVVRLSARQLLALGGAALLGATVCSTPSVRAETSPSCGAKTPSTGRAQPVVKDLYLDPGSPERRNLRERGMGGVLLTLSGHVYNEDCKPVARAMLDFFQSDSHGEYDRREIRLHGHQYTDGHGRYLLETIVPKGYLRRTPHIHVRVEAERGPPLVTQLFFPATLRAYGMHVAALNPLDPGFKRALTVRLGPLRHNHYRGVFDFVIADS